MAKKQNRSKNVISPDILQKLGQDLKRQRSDLKISVREAASLAGTSPGSVLRIEAGDEGVSFGLFLSYLSALGLSSSFLKAMRSSLKRSAKVTEEERVERVLSSAKADLLNDPM